MGATMRSSLQSCAVLTPGPFLSESIYISFQEQILLRKTKHNQDSVTVGPLLLVGQQKRIATLKALFLCRK